MKLLNKYIAVIQDPPETVNSIIIIPETVKHIPLSGIVRHTAKDTGLEVGDRVLFSKFAYEAVEHNGENLLIMHSDEATLTFENKQK